VGKRIGRFVGMLETPNGCFFIPNGDCASRPGVTMAFSYKAAMRGFVVRIAGMSAPTLFMKALDSGVGF
jgi:hypothetical protein